MVDKENYESLEDDFSRRRPELGDLYHAEMSNEDIASFCPILNALQGQASHYVDERALSVGGEKRITTVRDVRTDRTVVMAKPLHCHTDVQKEQFLREARVTACLQHPNVLTAYDVGVDAAGKPFFTMEYIQGDTLKELIEGQDPFSLARILDLFERVCDGLAYAHARGVLHLDVKPANIHIGPYGEALLCDWGLARVLTEERVDLPRSARSTAIMPNADLLNDITLTGTIKGTPGFMAPEQVCLNAQASKQTDVYSLGAVLYYILIGHPPEPDAKGVVTPPSRIDPPLQIPYGLEAVAMKALSVDPHDRYQSVVDFRNEIERYRTGFATRAQAAGAWTLLRLLVQRKRTAFIVGGIATLFLLAGMLMHMKRLSTQREAAIEAQHLAEESEHRYREETEFSRALSDDIRATAMDMINTSDFLNAKGKAKALKSHLSREQNPENRTVILEYLGVLYFVQQDFKSALECFPEKLSIPRYEKLVAIAKDYPTITNPNQLSPQEFAELLERVPRHIKDVVYFSYYNYCRKHQESLTANQALPIIKVLLDNINNYSWRDRQEQLLQLSQQGAGWKLRMDAQRYPKLKMPIAVSARERNALYRLNLKSIDIENASFLDPEELVGLFPDELGLFGMSTYPLRKAFVLKLMQVQRVHHMFSQSDAVLHVMQPDVEFIRVPDRGSR